MKKSSLLFAFLTLILSSCGQSVSDSFESTISSIDKSDTSVSSTTINEDESSNSSNITSKTPEISLSISLKESSIHIGDSTELTASYNGEKKLQAVAIESEYVNIASKDDETNIWIITGIKENNNVTIRVSEIDGDLYKDVNISIRYKMTLSSEEETIKITYDAHPIVYFDGPGEIEYSGYSVALIRVTPETIISKQYTVFRIDALAVGTTTVIFHCGDYIVRLPVRVYTDFDPATFDVEENVYIDDDDSLDIAKEMSKTMSYGGIVIYAFNVDHANHRYRYSSTILGATWNYQSGTSSTGLIVRAIRPNGLTVPFIEDSSRNRLYFRSVETGIYYFYVKNNTAQTKQFSGKLTISHSVPSGSQVCEDCGYSYI